MNEATIRLRIEKLADGDFLATSADVPGLVAEGPASPRPLKSPRALPGRSPSRVSSMPTHFRPPSPIWSNPMPASTCSRPSACRRWDVLPVSGAGRSHVGLRRLGYRFDRTGPGRHEVWRHVQTGRTVTLPRHTGDMAEGTSVRYFVRRYRRPRLPAHRLAGGDESSSHRAAFGTSNFIGRYRCGGGLPGAHR